MLRRLQTGRLFFLSACPLAGGALLLYYNNQVSLCEKIVLKAGLAMQKNITPTHFILRTALAVAATVAVLFALLLGAYALPGRPVRAHVARASEVMEQEGLYPAYLGFKLFQMDNYTDTIMLFEAATADESAPLTAMMTNTTYNMEDFVTMPAALQRYLALREQGLSPAALVAPENDLHPFDYARYWHGYLIWLRPLLAVVDYTTVRLVQYLVLGALLVAVLFRLYRAAGPLTAGLFLFSQLAVTVFWVPRQVQYFSTFMIAYAGCLWVLRRSRPAHALCTTLAVLGACTTFCDLLVTPILTLALPVAVWLSLPQQKDWLGSSATVVGGSLLWGGGYAFCWASKWVLASLITGRDIIGDAIHQAGVRTGADTWRGMEVTWGNIFRLAFGLLGEKHLLLPLAALALLALGAFFLCLKSPRAFLSALPLALTALMAPAWMAVLRTHSVQHMWFVWRNIAPTLFAGLLFLCRCCDWRLGLSRLTGRRSHP